MDQLASCNHRVHLLETTMHPINRLKLKILIHSNLPPKTHRLWKTLKTCDWCLSLGSKRLLKESSQTHRRSQLLKGLWPEEKPRNIQDKGNNQNIKSIGWVPNTFKRAQTIQAWVQIFPKVHTYLWAKLKTGQNNRKRGGKARQYPFSRKNHSLNSQQNWLQLINRFSITNSGKLQVVRYWKERNYGNLKKALERALEMEGTL